MACIRKRRGKYVVDWRDAFGRRRWATCATRQAAEDIFSDRVPKSRLRRRARVDPDVTLAQYSTQWLTFVAATTKPSTRDTYAKQLNAHIVPAFGDWKLRELGRKDLVDFLAAKLTGGAARGFVRLIHAVLRSLLAAAVRDEILAVNPARGLGHELRLVVPKAVMQERVRALTREQRDGFLQTANDRDRRLYPLFATLFLAGVRVGEAMALQWDHIDFDAKTIRVERNRSGTYMLTPKSGAARTIDLSPRLQRILRETIALRKAEALRNGKSGDALLFTTRAGIIWTRREVEKRYKRVLRLAALPTAFVCHDTRHTFASLLLSDGAPLKYVSEQLGHRDPSITASVYGRWLKTEGRSWLARMDAEATGSKTVAAADGDA
jgi:integrase